MMTKRRWLAVMAGAGLWLLVAPEPVAGQGQAAGRQGPVPRRAEAAGQAADLWSVVEVQRMFDAYALMQAEQVLKLSDAQYSTFLRRLRALQATRRKHQQARHQLIQELIRLTSPALQPPADEARLAERLKALVDLDERAGAELRSAYAAIDEVLDVRQRVRFRILEEQIERRKFELLARARGGRAGTSMGPSGTGR